MDDNRYPGVLDGPPDTVEQRIVGLVAAHLNMSFEDLSSVADHRVDVVSRVRFRVKRRGGKTIRRRPANLERRLIQPRRHLQACGIDQCGEATDAELPQRLKACGLSPPVGDRPFSTDQRTRGESK